MTKLAERYLGKFEEAKTNVNTYSIRYSKLSATLYINEVLKTGSSSREKMKRLVGDVNPEFSDWGISSSDGKVKLIINGSEGIVGIADVLESIAPDIKGIYGVKDLGKSVIKKLN